jgi:hypothetical protein
LMRHRHLGLAHLRFADRSVRRGASMCDSSYTGIRLDDPDKAGVNASAARYTQNSIIARPKSG